MPPFISTKISLSKLFFFTRPLFLLSFLIIYWLQNPVFAQFDDDVEIPENVVTFNARLEPENPRPGEHARIILDLKIHHGWHVFSVIPSEGDFSPIPTTLTFKDESLLMIGPAYESNPITAYNSVLDMVLSFHEDRVSLFQNIQIEKELSGGSLWKKIGNLTYQACSDRVCLPPKTDEFPLQILLGSGQVRSEFQIPQFAVDNPPEDISEIEDALKGGFWSFISLAVIAGFLALLTPCVFPMIPVTVAFFTRQGEARPSEMLRLASLFGLGIIGTYTVTGMLLSIVLGAAGAVHFATNGWVNFAIGLMFTFFAFSLMGFIQINAPSGLGNKVDRWSRHLSGTVGVLAMGLAFTLTSFTCTVQFVGTLLIAASQGMWLWPIVGMLVFSTVFAFPFFLLGIFPRLIQKMQDKSGNWMLHLKIILGLLELAAAFKFFSNSDLVWQLGVIDRDFVLAAWAILCMVAALFLLGVIKIHHARVEFSWGTGFVAAFLFAMLGIYLLRGLFGVPLNPWVDTYLPPVLQTFSESRSGFEASSETTGEIKSHSLPWQNDLSAALKQAKAENKKVFIDFTGYTCVNCRWMEKNIFSHPDVMSNFQQKFVLVQLYTDGGDKAGENQLMQISRFKTVALPLYVILDADNKILAKRAGIIKPAAIFLEFLN
ncbi:MAG: thioredoxin family protein [SAR324 cluster bacterium]|nr:thioredoxin family protein [SAR324 cluster bacterium]